jgi:hypothetical protein
MLHGITPDEHTWPITFSYAVGEYSTRGGIKAGFLFSLGFTIQRALLTTLGFIGLAYFYIKYNLDGPVYFIVGLVMAIAGSYILRGMYIHIPFDVLLGGHKHHTNEARRVPLHETHPREVPIKMTIVHGLIAGFGFGGLCIDNNIRTCATNAKHLVCTVTWVNVWYWYHDNAGNTWCSVWWFVKG